MIVATGDSNRQVKSLARNVADAVREAGGEVLASEGEENGEWVLVDLGAIVVHVMQPAVRAYYSLEELWGGQTPSRLHRGAPVRIADQDATPGE
jgi:ribosome-associated protein